MKALIELNDDNLASIEFSKNEKQTQWGELSRDEQIRLLGALSQFYGLFERFVKPE